MLTMTARFVTNDSGATTLSTTLQTAASGG